VELVGDLGKGPGLYQQTQSQEIESMMDQNEVYLGGFYSSMQLSLGKFGAGAGLYANSKRLFVFRKDMDVAFNKIAGRKDFVASGLTPEQNQTIVNQLSFESSSQIAFRREEISTLELKEPAGVFERDT
jgi:hypothetical protein